jgi:hypothetical protein
MSILSPFAVFSGGLTIMAVQESAQPLVLGNLRKMEPRPLFVRNRTVAG